MKKIILVFTLGTLLACQKQGFTLKNIDWTPESGAPTPVELEGTRTEVVSRVRFGSGSVEIDQQNIDGLEVDQAFVKKIQDNSGNLRRVQARLETRKLSRLSLFRWKVAQKNKDVVLKKILSAQPELKKKRIEDFRLKLAAVDDCLAPQWYLRYSEDGGDLWEVIYSYSLKPLSLEKLGSSFDVTQALVFPKGPKQSALENVYLFNLIKADNIMSSNLKVTSASEEKISVSGSPLLFNLTDGRFDQVQTFYSAQKALMWFERKLGVTSPQSLDVQIHVGSPDKTNTAFYYRGRVRLGTGDDVIYSKIPWDPSVVCHETSHYIVDLLAHLPFQGEGGSINEAYADYFAALILENPRLAEASFIPAPYKRRIDEPKKYSEKSGSLYGDSLIVSSLLWSLSKGLGEKGLNLAFSTLQNLNPQTDFETFREELLKQSRALPAAELVKLKSLMKEREWPVD